MKESRFHLGRLHQFLSRQFPDRVIADETNFPDARLVALVDSEDQINAPIGKVDEPVGDLDDVVGRSSCKLLSGDRGRPCGGFVEDRVVLRLNFELELIMAQSVAALEGDVVDDQVALGDSGRMTFVDDLRRNLCKHARRRNVGDCAVHARLVDSREIAANGGQRRRAWRPLRTILSANGPGAVCGGPPALCDKKDS